MSPAPAPEHMVTASDLVRHFGLWQDRASRTPIYILHRGRPHLVLVSVETMDALCARPAGTPPDRMPPRETITTTQLLDNIRDIVLLADGEHAISASSRSARAHFGALATPGAPIDTITPPPSRALLAEAMRRVSSSGIGERLTVASAARVGRMLALRIEPIGDGTGIFAEDVTPLAPMRAAPAERPGPSDGASGKAG